MFEEIFAHKKIAFDKLEAFGFQTEKGGVYVYAANICSGQFLLKIMIGAGGKMTSRVFDNDTDDEYVLYRAESAVGAFVGKVREECARILQKIADECCVESVFKNDMTLAVMAHIRQKYGDEFEFLWEKFPDNAIVRRKDNQKWYAVILTISRQKLGLNGNDKIEVMDLRGLPEEIAGLTDGQKYFPGYHMNKKHWYTLCLDGSVGLEEICRRVDESYQLAKK